jgi:hypothetical protein
MPLGQSEAFQATASATGQLAAVRVYLDGASTVARLTVGLYTDSGGQPSRRLTQGALNFPAAAGWSTVPVTATTVTAGRRYWIALLGSGGGLLRYRDRSSGSCLSRTSAQTSLRELPFAWRTARTYGDCPLSAYALATAGVKAARATPSSTRCKRRGARCPRPSKKRKRRSR